MGTSRTKIVLLNVAAGLLASVLLLAVVSADAATPAASQAADAAKTTKKNAAKKRLKTVKGSAKTTAKPVPMATANAGAKAVPKIATKNTAKTPLKTASAKTATAKQGLAKKTIAQQGQKPAVTAPKSAIPDATAEAASAQLQANPVAKTETKAPSKIWSVETNIAGSRSVYDHQDGTAKASTDMLTDISIKATDTVSVLAEITYSRDEKNPEGSDWGDTLFQVSRKGYEMTSALTLGPNAFVIVPTSKGSRENTNLNAVVGTGISLGFAKGVLPASLTLIGQLNIARYLTQYETAADGSINKQWSSRQRIIFIVEMPWNFKISGQVAHKSSQNFAGAISESFVHAEELAYGINDNWSVSVGHSLDGSMYKANGIDSNFALVNENDSTYYAGLTVSF